MSKKFKKTEHYSSLTAQDLNDINKRLADLKAQGETVTDETHIRLVIEALGRAEGRAEGITKGQAINVASMISWRYADCNQDLLDKVKSNADPSFLERVGKALLRSKNLRDFLRLAQI